MSPWQLDAAAPVTKVQLPVAVPERGYGGQQCDPLAERGHANQRGATLLLLMWPPFTTNPYHISFF